MAARMLETDVYLALRPERRSYQREAVGLSVTGVRKSPPKGVPYIRLRLRVPAAAFTVFTAERTVEVEGVGYEAGDASVEAVPMPNDAEEEALPAE